jgi:uncharacterized membrane protein YtjA (UPF0391 family)
MNSTVATLIAAAMGLLAQNGTAAIWGKAVFYHFIHAVMLFVLADRKPFPAAV